jgi:hypothetical protein
MTKHCESAPPLSKEAFTTNNQKLTTGLLMIEKERPIEGVE